MRVFTFKAEERDINRFYLICVEEGYHSMSECIRALIRRYMLEHGEPKKKEIRIKRVILK